MYNRNRKIVSFLRRLPVILVYLLFLSVQVLFNLDISSQPDVLFQPIISAKSHIQPGHQGWKIRLDKKKNQSTIRLNKRFEPSGMPGFPSYHIQTPIVYAQVMEIGTEDAGTCHAACLHKHTLRGPPSLVI
jgi:hypothetical protein